MQSSGTNLRSIAYILAVADGGSLAAAAERVRISPSAISAAVKAQEAELGYPIFVRRPARPLKLTSLGREFVGNARTFMERFHAFIEASRGLRETVSGQITIGCFSSFAPLVVPPVLARLRDAHPELTTLLLEGDHAVLVQALESGDAELAITYDFVRERTLRYEPIFPVKPYALIAATHKLARRRSIALKSLAAEELIAIDLESIRGYLLSLFAAKGIVPRLWQPTKSIRMLYSLVAHGLGYTVVFLRTSAEPVAHRDLRCVPLADEVPIHHVAIATPRYAPPTRRAQTFIDACHAVLGRPTQQRRFQVGF
jgi:DNA-binding transcriptional LysR family regulator